MKSQRTFHREYPTLCSNNPYSPPLILSARPYNLKLHLKLLKAIGKPFTLRNGSRHKYKVVGEGILRWCLILPTSSVLSSLFDSNTPPIRSPLSLLLFVESGSKLSWPTQSASSPMNPWTTPTPSSVPFAAPFAAKTSWSGLTSKTLQPPLYVLSVKHEYHNPSLKKRHETLPRLRQGSSYCLTSSLRTLR